MHSVNKMSSSNSSPVGDVRVCSACAATVERKNCHKNRYSQYICRQCQEAGVKYTQRKRQGSAGRRRSVVKWALTAFFLGLVIAGLAFPVIWDSLNSDGMPSVLGRSTLPIDLESSVLLNAENRARLIEGLDRKLIPAKPVKP